MVDWTFSGRTVFGFFPQIQLAILNPKKSSNSVNTSKTGYLNFHTSFKNSKK
jgi:hypothetical protein